jgi:NADPH2:quinone reductase
MRMKAVWYERTGPAAEVLIYGEQPKPEPKAGEIRVRLRASGVNPADCYRRAGTSYAMEAPFVIAHSDGAGVVDAVGEGVTKVRVGERVWLYNGQRNGRNLGTAAEYIALDADLVTPLPDNVPFEAGACLGIPCMTAHACTLGYASLEGKTVLVTGAGGAVGNYAVQLARWGGALVIATVSTGTHAEDARAAGADVVIDRRSDVAAQIAAATDGHGVDHVAEVDFGGNLDTLMQSVAVNGTIAVYASRGRQTPTIDAGLLMRRCLTLRFVVLPSLPLTFRRQAQSDITRWLGEGPRLHRVVGPYPLAETVAAHQAVEAGGKRGTVVVAMS